MVNDPFVFEPLKVYFTVHVLNRLCKSKEKTTRKVVDVSTWSASHYALKFCLTLKASVTTAADDIYTYFLHCFSEKIRLDVLM